MEPSTSNNTTSSFYNVCAVVITHNPDKKFLTLLEELEHQVSQIIVVDNNSSDDGLELVHQSKLVQNLILIENGENKGVAAGLNQGFKQARKLEFEWGITFDQDSKPNPDMIEKLWKLLKDHPDSSRIAVVAPNLIDAELGRSTSFLRRKSHLFYERIHCHAEPLEDVTTVITAGSLVRLSSFEESGGFREDFFIDYVDTEFCLRLLLHGYKILVACDAELHHTLGDRRKWRWGFLTLYPTYHSPQRWYTISRNRIQMIKSYGFRIPHWLLYEWVATSYIILRMLLTEDERLAKLSALIKGTWDGLWGKLGKPYWAIEQTNTSK